jgi:ribonuclease HII
MGPVVASAVVLPENCVIEGLDDSKKLSEQKREALYEIIQEKAIAIGVGMADPAEIDEINILNATKRSMKRAIEDLGESPDYLLIDAVELADIDTEQLALIKGDARSLSIAAASVIAKVTRDRIVAEMDQTYPGYGFAQHKGYGTKAHYEAIENYGITPVHRRSFLKNIL